MHHVVAAFRSVRQARRRGQYLRVIVIRLRDGFAKVLDRILERYELLAVRKDDRLIEVARTAFNGVSTLVLQPLGIRGWLASLTALHSGQGAPFPLCNATSDNDPSRSPEGFKTEYDKDGWRH
jgi:hypothetical protein